MHNHVLAAILADPSISPAYRDAVATNAMPARRAAYVSSLLRMDWTFEHSDDHGVWKRGRDELTRLRAERAECDPSGDLWRKHAPEEYRE